MKSKDNEGVRALYVRVSTEAQAEEGYSVGAQTERLQSYCKAMGWAKTEGSAEAIWSAPKCSG